MSIPSFSSKITVTWKFSITFFRLFESWDLKRVAMSSTSSSSQLDQREFDANNNKNENSDRKQKLAKKHFLLHEIEEAMTMSSTNLRVLTATRETSYRLWDRCIRTCIGNMHKTLRDIRRQGTVTRNLSWNHRGFSGATKLCKKYYDEVALETRRYHRLTHARGKILGSTNIGEYLPKNLHIWLAF